MTHYEIYDTPGVSEQTESVATTQAIHVLKDSAAIILVISPGCADDKNLTDFRDQIEQSHPNILEEKNRIIVLINKYDLCFPSSQTIRTCTWDPETFREKISSQIKVPAKSILCVSAKYALMGRIWKHGS